MNYRLINPEQYPNLDYQVSGNRYQELRPDIQKLYEVDEDSLDDDEDEPKDGYDVVDAVIDGILEDDGTGSSSNDDGRTMETDTMGGGDFGGGGSDGDW